MNHIILLSLILYLFFSVSIRAQKTDSVSSLIKEYDENRFIFSAGGFISGVNSGVRIGSKQLGAGLDINLEDALGLDATNFIFRLNSMYVFGKKRRHGIKGSYFAFLRSAYKKLETEIEFEDVIYPIGTELNSTFNFSIIKLAYDYAFFADDRINMGLSAGLYIMPITFSITVVGEPKNQIADFIAPLPYAGLRSDFKILPKLFLKQGMDVLYVKFDNYSGAILDINIRIEHNTWKHFGFGGGLDFYKVMVRSETNSGSYDFVGNVQISYSGVLLYAKYYF